LKELTINIKTRDQDSSDVDPADILWRLLLLRADIKVMFEGITPGLGKTSTERTRSPETEADFGRQIALAKYPCNIELKKPGWEERCWVFHGMRDAETMLYALDPPDKEPFCLDDIVNMSPVWKSIQSEIDHAEASNSEQ
jgi:hypothetical protein